MTIKGGVRVAPTVVRVGLSHLFPRLAPRRVFAIGFGKTGTHSLHALFTTLGYKSLHGGKWRRTLGNPLLFRFEAFSDGPPDDFRRLDTMFPGARFILNVRDLNSWIESCLNHICKHEPRSSESYRPFSYWTPFNSSVFELTLNRNRHHAQVLSHFAGRDDLLVVNYVRDPDAPAKISHFLGHRFEGEKPHAFESGPTEHPLASPERIEALLLRLGIPREEQSNDIFCPSIDGGDFDATLPDTRFLDGWAAPGVEGTRLVS